MTTAVLEPVTRQRQQALIRANKVRHGSAAFRREVAQQPMAQGLAILADALEQPVVPEIAGVLTVERFIGSARRHGPRKVAQVLNRAAVGRYPNRERRHGLRVRDLTLPERSRLAAVLREDS